MDNKIKFQQYHYYLRILMMTRDDLRLIKNKNGAMAIMTEIVHRLLNICDKLVSIN